MGLTTIFFFFFIKSRNLFKYVLVLLSASVERGGVSRMRDFCVCKFVKLVVDGLLLTGYPVYFIFREVLIQKSVFFSFHYLCFDYQRSLKGFDG